jgi:hypothetical protein
MTDRFERPTLDVIETLRGRTHDLANAIQAEREERKVFEAVLVGADGDNGKIGTLARELAEERATRKKFGDKIIAAIAGSAVVALLAIYNAGIKRGDEDAAIAQLKAQVAELQQLRQQLLLRLLTPGVSP